MCRDEAPAPGDIVLLNRSASCQFTTPLRARVIRVLDDRPEGWAGWKWLLVYVLDDVTNDALSQREVYVRVAGLPRAVATIQAAAARLAAPSRPPLRPSGTRAPRTDPRSAVAAPASRP